MIRYVAYKKRTEKQYYIEYGIWANHHHDPQFGRVIDYFYFYLCLDGCIIDVAEYFNWTAPGPEWTAKAAVQQALYASTFES